jgi:hypothetical protein
MSVSLAVFTIFGMVAGTCRLAEFQTGFQTPELLSGLIQTPLEAMCALT